MEMFWTVLVAVVVVELVAIGCGFASMVATEPKRGPSRSSDLGAAVWAALTCIGAAVAVLVIVNGWRV